MSLGQGYRTKAGLAREGDQTSWSSTTAPAVLGAGDLIPLLSESVEERLNRLPIDVLEGKAGRTASDITGVRYTGQIRLQGQYSGLESVLALAFGAEEPQVSPTTGPSGVYSRYYEFDSVLQTRSWQFGEGFRFDHGLLFGDKRVARGTLGIDKDVSLWEFASAMVGSIELNANTADGLVIGTELVTRDLDRASTTNVTSTGWTYPGGRNRVLFHDLTARLGVYSTGTSLSSGDNVRISDFSIRIENNLEADTQTANSSRGIEEPVRNGVRTVTGSITIPCYRNDTFFDRHDADTLLMGDFKFTGPDIGSSTARYRLNIYLPSFRLTKASAPVNGPGTVAETYSLEALIPAGEPSGFPFDRLNSELFIELQNDVSVNVLYTT
ncbi:phage tail tube protein [candidate division KSB1 bacterium]